MNRLFADIISAVRIGVIFLKNNYDAVLFDFDGTIADTGKGVFNAVRYAVESLGFEPLTDASLRTFIGPPLSDSFKRECGMTDEQSEEAVSKYREIYSEKCIYEFELYDGIDALIRDIKSSGIKLAIASSKPEKFVKRLLNQLGYDEIIDYISAPTFDKDHMSKKELINNAVNALGVEKKRTIMIGDRLFDIIGANEAEVESIGAVFGYGSEEELKEAGATYLVSHADEIRNIIFS